ncbi:MAG: DUF5684 domain-containing protein [Actinomycetota bacterium]
MLGQYTSGGNGGGGNPVVVIVYLALAVLGVAGMWKTFGKAGQPGWAAIVPIYNLWILIKIAGKPGWWLVLFLIPFVNLIALVLISIGVAENFGKSAGFGFGLALLSFIFYPILGFGDAQYRGAATGMPPAPPMPA